MPIPSLIPLVAVYHFLLCHNFCVSCFCWSYVQTLREWTYQSTSEKHEFWCLASLTQFIMKTSSQGPVKTIMYSTSIVWNSVFIIDLSSWNHTISCTGQNPSFVFNNLFRVVRQHSSYALFHSTTPKPLDLHWVTYSVTWHGFCLVQLLWRYCPRSSWDIWSNYVLSRLPLTSC